MPTRAWSTPACGTSSTKRATSRRPPAFYHVHPQTGLGELRNRGHGTGHGPKGEIPVPRSTVLAGTRGAGSRLTRCTPPAQLAVVGLDRVRGRFAQACLDCRLARRVRPSVLTCVGRAGEEPFQFAAGLVTSGVG